MLIQNNNSNIFTNNKNNTFTFSSRKVNLSQLAPQNKDMLFLSFKGSEGTWDNNHIDEPRILALKSTLNQQLADLERQLFDNNLPPNKKTLKSTFDTLCWAIEAGIQLKIDPEKYLALINKILAESKKQPEQNQLVSEWALALLREVYLFVDNKEFENKAEQIFINYLKQYPPNNLSACALVFFIHFDKNNNDEDVKKLNEIVAKVNSFEDLKSSDYLKARDELFRQEFKILYQEFTEPEKHLLRAIKMGVSKSLSEAPENLLELQLKALRGISNHLSVLTQLNLDLNYIPYNDLVEKCTTILNKKESSPTSEALKITALIILYQIYNFISPENKEKAENIAFDIIKNSNSMEMKKWAITLFVSKIEKSNEISNRFVEYSVGKLNNTNTSEQEKITALIALARLEYNNTGKLIVSTLSDANTVKKDKIAALMETKIFSSPDSIRLINNILSDNSITTSKKCNKILNLTQFETSSVRTVVEDILNNSKSSHPLKMTAAWVAGLDHTDTNFKLLLNIINPDQPVNKTSTANEELELKEMALYSLAEFGNKDVKSVLEKIAASKSELSEQALALIEKNNPKYYDGGLIKELLNNQNEQDAYKKLRNEYVPDFEKLPSDYQYWIDKALIPFRTILKETVSNNGKLILINDTTTAINKTDRGIRDRHGFFGDAAGGESAPPLIIIPRFNFDTPSRPMFVFGHEWGHQILSNIYHKNPPLFSRLKEAYNKALKENKCLNSYAAGSIGEYFATGNEAYLSVYKPHEGLIDSNDCEFGVCKTRYILKRKDPELYNLIEEVYKYYNQQNLIKPLNFVA